MLRIKLKYLDDIQSLRASLKNYSVVVETDSDVSDEIIRNYADGLLKLKCKDFYFTGDDKARWHMLFDREDDRVSDGKALTSDIHDTDFLDFLHICKRKVLILRIPTEIRIKNANYKLKYRNECLADEIERFYLKQGVNLSIEKITIGNLVSFFCATVKTSKKNEANIAKIGETILAKKLGFSSINIIYTDSTFILEIPNNKQKGD